MPAIQVTRLSTNPHQSDAGIRADTSSRGVDLAGALITVTYTDGSSENLVWAALDPYTFGGATGAEIDMHFGFDLHDLSVTRRLAMLEIDLQPASSVFDTTPAMDTDPEGGSTPGSANGFSFLVGPDDQGLEGTIDVTYSGIVNLTGSPAAGDLFTTMVVDFRGLADGGFLGAMRWNSDIDTMRDAGDLTPVPVQPFGFGSGGADSIEGTEAADVLRGFGGADTLLGAAGDDMLYGGNHADSLAGGADNDLILGQGGADQLFGGDGQDSIFGGAGGDMITGGDGADSILGQGGADTILGGTGADTLNGGSGDDSILGGAEDDTLVGNGNNDTLRGEGGSDSLLGNAGADLLLGGAGEDTLFSGIGSDRLDGGAGDDLLNGGVADGARDSFVFRLGYDQDRINQFDQAGSDRIELDQGLWAATDPGLSTQEVVDMFGTLSLNGTMLTLDFGGGDILEVQNSNGVDQASLGADIFIV